MKKLLSVFLVMLVLVGCAPAKEKAKPITTKVQTVEETGSIEEQKEVVVEKTPEVTKPTNNTPLPVVGNSRLIVIDAGHQRSGNNEKEPIGPGASETKAKVTSGATGINSGQLESQINLDVAFKLQSQLEASGYQVIMVRTSQNVNISNSERAAVANENNAGAFIRLHCNSDDSSSVNGVLTMAPSTSNPYCSQIATASKSLSSSVLNNICNETGAKNRGVMISDTMSGINWCKVPVTIVEMGFLSNPTEDQLLNSDDYQNKLVRGIVKGINEYMN